MHPGSGGRGQRLSVGLAWALVLVYGAGALLVMWRAPRVPYADGWRFLGNFASGSFPGNVFRADNGHYEVLPNAVRVAEMYLLGANQALQVAVGIALLLASIGLGWLLLRRLRSPQLRAAGLLVLVVGLCWLGNVRALAHGNETVHAYAVTLFLLLGVHVLIRRQRPPTCADAALASLCGLLAALSFGSGIAVFVSFVAIAMLRRGSWRVTGVLCGSAVLVFVLLRAGGGGAGLPAFAPLQQLDIALRWLAAPWLYTVWPAVDPAIAGQVPVPQLQALLGRTAHGWESLFGPATLSRWPHAAIGAVGVAGLLWSSFRCWRKGQADSHARLLGLALAWFALAVGGMAATVRMPYFETHPEQIVATRYLVWSSLFWAGLGISAVAAASRQARALTVVLVVAVALLPSQVWMFQMAESLRRAADQTAVAAAVGVLDPQLETGETVPAELAVALPPLREMGTTVFAWPETRALGAPLPAAAVAVPVRQLEVERVDNLLGEPGRRVRMQAGVEEAGRLLLVDPDGIVRGLAIPRAGAGEGDWIGWMQGGGTAGAVQAARLTGD